MILLVRRLGDSKYSKQWPLPWLPISNTSHKSMSLEGCVGLLPPASFRDPVIFFLVIFEACQDSIFRWWGLQWKIQVNFSRLQTPVISSSYILKNLKQATLDCDAACCSTMELEYVKILLSTIPKTLLTMTQNLYSILRYNEGSWPHSIINLMYCGLKFEHGLRTTTIFQASSFWATTWSWCLKACTTILVSAMTQVRDFIIWKFLFTFQWIISGVCLNSCVFKDLLYRHEYSTWDSFPFESQASMIFYPVVREDDMRNRWVRKR